MGERTLNTCINRDRLSWLAAHDTHRSLELPCTKSSFPLFGTKHLCRLQPFQRPPRLISVSRPGIGRVFSIHIDKSVLLQDIDAVRCQYRTESGTYAADDTSPCAFPTETLQYEPMRHKAYPHCLAPGLQHTAAAAECSRRPWWCPAHPPSTHHTGRA